MNCKCGCGKPPNFGKVYISGHNAKGRVVSEETKRKLSLQKMGSNNPMYGKPRSAKNSEAVLRSIRGNRWMVGRKLSEETRKKMSEARMGDKHWNWRGGITPINLRIRSSRKYIEWRDSVYRRDNYTCLWCRKRGVELNADHIKPFAFFPELRFELSNGRTLCAVCHNTTKISAKEMHVLYL